MTADARIYLSERLAYRYAFHRPPVHASIWTRIAATHPPDFEVLHALDIGCGAGASTQALESHARHVTGIDPSDAMLRHARRALPKATFILGSSEALPLSSGSYDLVAAAGSLNYSRPTDALREISRVLRPDGRLVVYDFSFGRVVAEGTPAASSFKALRDQFPPLPGYTLDLKALPYKHNALELVTYQEFDVTLSMSLETYVEYIMGETNVEAVIAAGMAESDARHICMKVCAPLFASEAREVRFPALFAIARKTPNGTSHDSSSL